MDHVRAARILSSRPAMLLVCLAASLFFGPAGWAEGQSGRLVGVLTDQSGAVVPQGKVEVKNLATGATLSTLSDRSGRYVFEALPEGRYGVSASFAGLETARRSNVSVTSEGAAVVDLVLPLAKIKTLVVVTAPAMSQPLIVETDPRAPRQPIPAHDGADYVKAIPGFSVIRKGGTDGDPVLRGMSGSRLGVLQDGQAVFGGCGGRMDPPTAYVYPGAYDRITVIKGPESVQYGPGNSAGAVLFEREIQRVERPGALVNGSLTGGSFGRHDEMLDMRMAAPSGYVRGIATRSHTGDFRDGQSVAVHSFYTRWSGNAALGWTPAPDTALELSLAKSNGEAAYADRGMDGPRFARDNAALRFERTRAASWLRRIEAQAYYNHIDHVMDNYSLRAPGASFTAMNPDRRTTGGRAAATLALGSQTKVVLGGDTRRDTHRGRSAMGGTSADIATSMYEAQPRVEDMRFSQVGAFGELTRDLSQRSRIIAGLRGDWHQAVDSRACVAASMCPGSSPARNDTRGATDRKTLVSGFGRYELGLGGGASTLYAGVGHVERFPDYWERLQHGPTTLKSAFLTTRPEKTTQIDLGWLWKSGAWSGSVSGFHGWVRDYVLIRWSPAPTLTRNVNARTTGGEAEVAYRVAQNLKASAAFAYVRGENDTDRKPLAQQPPLETRLGLSYDRPRFSVGALARFVGPQRRVDVGSGDIVVNGMDIGQTGGFSVFSINGATRLTRNALLTTGIDNLLNKTYAEHLSKAGAMVSGFIQTGRINEPGRTLWVKLSFNN